MMIRMVVFCILFMATTICEAVNVGDTKESVLKEMGNPLGHMNGGGLEIMRYANGEVEIRNGRVKYTTLPRSLDRPQGATSMAAGVVSLQNVLTLRYSFDEASGTVRDHSGRGNAAKAHGAVYTPDGKYNGAYEFDGRGAFMQTSKDVDLMPPYTLTAWVYLRSRLEDGGQFAAYRGRTILARGDLKSSGQWDYIFNVNAYGKLGFVTHSSFSRADAIQNPDVFPLNAWVFVAFTHEGETGRLYQNGRLVRTRAHMKAGNTHRKPGTFIGKIYNTHPTSRGDHFWDGMIDELRVYKKALSEQELASVQHEHLPKTVASSANGMGSPAHMVLRDAPVFHLSFDDGTCTDVSGGGHDGTGHGVRPVSDAVNGQAMKLDGLDAYISVNRNQNMTLGPSDNRTISLWWKADLIDEQTQSLLSMRGSGDGQRGLSVELYKGKYYRLHLRFYHHADFPVTLQAHRWNHLVVVKRGTDWSLYHNGVRLTDPVVRGWPFTENANADVPLWIGRDHASGNFFGGIIDEVMFFDRALSEDEVKRICDSTQAVSSSHVAVNRPVLAATAQDVEQPHASAPEVVQQVRKPRIGNSQTAEQLHQPSIGDREGSVRQQCGAPAAKHVQKDGDAYKLTFLVGGQNVIVGFRYGKVQYLEYSGHELTDAQIRDLLENNSGGHVWTKRVPEKDDSGRGAPPSWIRDDKVIAWYYRNRLTIKTLAWPNGNISFREVPLEKAKRSEDAQPDRSASIVGKWLDRRDGLELLIEFDRSGKMGITSIERGIVNETRGQYRVDYTTDPISIDLYDLSGNESDGNPVYGIAEFDSYGRLLFDLETREPGASPKRPTSFGGDALELRRASDDDFARELAEAKAERDALPPPPEIRGETLPKYSHVAATYSSGQPSCVWLGADVKIQGVTCWNGNPVTFHQNGQLESADLVGDQRINDFDCPSGSTIYFFASGQIEQAQLAGDQVINDVRCRDGVTFFESGQIESTCLAADQMIDGIEYCANTKLTFHENGRVKEGTLATDCVIDGIPHKKGKKVRFPEEDKALARGSQNAQDHVRLALKWIAKGDYDKAIENFSDAIALHDSDPALWHSRGLAWQKKGDSKRAMADFNHALELTQDRSQIYTSMGTLKYQQGQTDLALDFFNRALASNPTNVVCLVNRSLVWADRKEYTRTAGDLERALEIEPENEAVAGNLAWFLATCAEDGRRNGGRALQLAQKAVDRTRSGPNLDTLAAAYAELGNFKQALQVQEDAISAVEANGPKGLLPQFKERLSCYRENRAWRE